MLENFTETEAPDNRPVFIEEEIPSITRGATCVHTFTLPFNCEEHIQDLSIIYNQGLDTVLTKDFIDCVVTEGVDSSVIMLTLSSTDTLLFEPNLLDIYVQIKVLTIDNETLYETPIELTLYQTLDN